MALFSTRPSLFFLFLFFFPLPFSSQATLFSIYPSAINTSHYSHSSNLPLQLKLKSSFCSVSVSISISTVGFVVRVVGCHLGSIDVVFRVGYPWVYVFMFKRVCICCFWAVGKRGKKSETWSGKERKYGLWVREKRKKKKKMEWGREQIWACFFYGTLFD